MEGLEAAAADTMLSSTPVVRSFSSTTSLPGDGCGELRTERKRGSRRIVTLRSNAAAKQDDNDRAGMERQKDPNTCISYNNSKIIFLFQFRVFGRARAPTPTRGLPGALGPPRCALCRKPKLTGQSPRNLRLTPVPTVHRRLLARHRHGGAASSIDFTFLAARSIHPRPSPSLLRGGAEKTNKSKNKAPSPKR